jgi:prevent-host-death family protein
MTWSVSKAKAKLSEVLARARRGPQLIASRGETVAVVLSKAEYEALLQASRAPQASPMQQWLARVEVLKQAGSLELELPPRVVDAPRPLPFDDD